VALCMGLYRLVTRGKPPEEVTEQELRARRTEKGLGVIGIMTWLGGCVLAAVLAPAQPGIAPMDQAATAAGQITGVFILIFILLGGVLRLSGARQAVGVATLVGGGVCLLWAFVQTEVVGAQARDKAAIAEARTLLQDITEDRTIVPRDYAVADYGPTAYALTVVSHDAAESQKQERELRAREQSVGFPTIGAATTLADPAQRAAAHRQLAELKQIYAGEQQGIDGLMTRIRADVDKSLMPELSKKAFFGAFDASEANSNKMVDDFYATAQQTLDHAEKLLTIADEDQPQLMFGKVMFRSDAHLAAAQAEMKTLQDLARQVEQKRAAMRKRAQDAANKLR